MENNFLLSQILKIDLKLRNHFNSDIRRSSPLLCFSEKRKNFFFLKFSFCSLRASTDTDNCLRNSKRSGTEWAEQKKSSN